MCADFKNGKCTSDCCPYDGEKMICCKICAGRAYCREICHG